MKYVLGIDFGGGASKATLLSQNGEIIATASSEYPTYYPQTGYAEQNSDDWYLAAKNNIKAVIDKSKIAAHDIACISLDAATHTAVICDDDFNVLCPSIYWTDTRCTDEVKYLKENYNDLILKQSFHTVSTIWTLPQLMWLFKHKSSVMKKANKIMFAKDYVRHMLTGDFCTDRIEAEGSMIYDMNKQEWSSELCEICSIDKALLPTLKNPEDIAGYVTKAAAQDTGLSENTPVICGTTDTVMEVFAAGAVNKCDMTVKLATAGRICIITDKPYPNVNLVNYSHISKGLWYPGTATKSCASSFRWFRDTFGGDYGELDSEAEKISIGSDGLVFHPYLNGELTPYNDPDLCASFLGIRGGHTKAHFTRAVLEGVAFSMLDSLKVIENLKISHSNKATIIGGGSKSTLWRQIIADCLGTELSVRENSDSSFGSAMLAGIAAGFWMDENDALSVCSKTAALIKPDSEKTESYRKYYEKYKAVHDALEGIYR